MQKSMNNEPNDPSKKNKNRKKPANRASFVFSGTNKIVILFNWKEFLSFLIGYALTTKIKRTFSSFSLFIRARARKIDGND